MLITGAGGFAGRHLIRHLDARGILSCPSAVRLPDRPAFRGLLKEFRPDAVVHLAAVSFLPSARDDPASAIRTNVEGTISVLESLNDADPAGRVRFVFASSAQVYRLGGALPLIEDSPVEAATLYGETKIAAEILSRSWCEAPPARPLWIFRAFNHTGPGQRPEFAAPSFARQVAAMEAGLQKPILETGDLSVIRDFCDVRDVVRAYAEAAAGEAPPGIYNLSSGRSVSIEWIAGHFRSRSRVPFEIRPRNEPARSGEAREIRGSAAKAERAFGWKARIPLEETLDDLLSEWRERMKDGKVRGFEEPPGSGRPS